MIPQPQQRISLEEGIKSMSDVEYAEYIISTMGGGFGECDKCQKDALEATRTHPDRSTPAAKECIGGFDECRTVLPVMGRPAILDADAALASTPFSDAEPFDPAQFVNDIVGS